MQAFLRETVDAWGLQFEHSPDTLLGTPVQSHDSNPKRLLMWTRFRLGLLKFKPTIKRRDESDQSGFKRGISLHDPLYGSQRMV